MNKGTALVPKLRFPAFRDAEGWEETRLGDVASFFKGKGISKADIATNGRHPCIRYGELYTRYGEVIDEVFSRTNVADADLFFSQSNDVIIPASGETKLDIAKASCVMHGDVALGSVLNVIRGGNNGIFLSYYFNGPKKLDIAKVAQGDAVVHLYLSQLEALPVAIPEKPEQQKIADCLTSVDELIAAQARKVDALKTHKKGLMQQLFPREGETQPHLRFPEFQNVGEWVVDPFDKVIEVVDGDRGVNYPKAEEFSQTGFCLFLNAKNVTKTGFKFEEMQFVSKEKDKDLRKGKLKREDVALTTRGTVGQFAYYSEEIPYENIRINSGMVILRIKTKKIVPDYLYAFTSSDVLTSYIKNIAFGNAQQQLTVSEIKKFKLYYPEPNEQQCIADCLTSLDDLIAVQTQKLAALKTHKKGLMQQLFPSPKDG